MGFRYRRSYKILPGVQVNVGKKSNSVTFGGKIFRTTVNKTRGTVTRSVSTPIKGLTYTETQKIEKRPQNTQERVEYSPSMYRICSKLMFGVAVIAAVLAILSLIVAFIDGAIGMTVVSVLSFLFGRSWRSRANQMDETQSDDTGNY